MTEFEARGLYVNTAKSYLNFSEASGKHRQIIDLYNNRRRNRISVYNPKSHFNPSNLEANSPYEFNDSDNLDMLQKKYLFIISKYEMILKESSNMNKTLEENANLVEELKSRS